MNVWMFTCSVCMILWHFSLIMYGWLWCFGELFKKANKARSIRSFFSHMSYRHTFFIFRFNLIRLQQQAMRKFSIIYFVLLIVVVLDIWHERMIWMIKQSTNGDIKKYKKKMKFFFYYIFYASIHDFIVLSHAWFLSIHQVKLK